MAAGTRVLRTVAIDALAWAAVQVAAGYVVHRLPARRLERDGPLLRIRPWEGEGRVYDRALRIRRWKHRLPEGGAVFPGGVDKRHVGGRGEGVLEAYARETRRAELGHWLAMAPAPLFMACNPPGLRAAMAAYAVAVNGPCIVSQRYNRARIDRVLSARARRGAAVR